MHLDLTAIEAELVRTEGNITAAATALSVPSADLRKLVWSTASLTDVIFEQLEQMIDEAAQVLRDGLTFISPRVIASRPVGRSKQPQSAPMGKSTH